MSRPFGDGPPALPDGFVARPRLTDRLDRRWERRLVTVVAGPGFGKSSLLAEAFTRGGPLDDDRDVWLTCTPSDASGPALVDALGEAIGIGPASFDGLLRAVWHLAPQRICFVVDDLHELRPGSDGADVMRQFVHDLPHNGHVVLSSRSSVPWPVASIAATGQLDRVTEAELAFSDEEVEDFARRRGLDPSLLGATAGWPALLELTASAATDLVAEYVWGEVLARIGPARSRELATIAAVGEVDEELVGALLGPARTVESVVDGVPLVRRTHPAGGVATVRLHPLWDPIVRPILDDADADAARRTAAAIHREHGRWTSSIALFAETRDWDEVLATILGAAVRSKAFEDWYRFDGWYELLPQRFRDEPVAHLAKGIAIAASVPDDAMASFRTAAERARERGECAVELVVLERHGVVAWWANDVGTLFELIGRATELASAGLAEADVAARVGRAAIAHVSGDPHGVLDVLDPVDIDTAGGWAPGVAWFRMVAHRRLGDLERADRARETAERLSPGDVQVAVAGARSDWLRGRVDESTAVLESAIDHYRTAKHQYLWLESTLEAAARAAWVGDRRTARRLLDDVTPDLLAAPGALAEVLYLLAAAAIAVDAGDEATARGELAVSPLARPGTQDSWYWIDRGAVGLLYVLFPDDRERWAEEFTAVHAVGVLLAETLVSVREGATDRIAALAWPSVGVARAHFPAAWLAELAAAGTRVGNPPPDDLVEQLVSIGRSPFAARMPSSTQGPVELRVLGAIEVRCGGEPLEHPDLRRRRVRELLAALVTGRWQRREELADLLWPDVVDPRHNLRVTLGYLQHVAAAAGVESSVLSDQNRIRLVASPGLRCDLWEFDAALGAAELAHREADPAAALRSYDAARASWRGEPFAELVDVDWARDVQASYRSRFVAAMVRAGELHVAAGDVDSGLRSARAALDADRYDESAHRLCIRSHLVAGDVARAAAAADACRCALDELSVGPSPATAELIASFRGPR